MFDWKDPTENLRPTLRKAYMYSQPGHRCTPQSPMDCATGAVYASIEKHPDPPMTEKTTSSHDHELSRLREELAHVKNDLKRSEERNTFLRQQVLHLQGKVESIEGIASEDLLKAGDAVSLKFELVKLQNEFATQRREWAAKVQTLERELTKARNNGGSDFTNHTLSLGQRDNAFSRPACDEGTGDSICGEGDTNDATNLIRCLPSPLQTNFSARNSPSFRSPNSNWPAMVSEWTRFPTRISSGAPSTILTRNYRNAKPTRYAAPSIPPTQFDAWSSIPTQFDAASYSTRGTKYVQPTPAVLRPFAVESSTTPNTTGCTGSATGSTAVVHHVAPHVSCRALIIGVDYSGQQGALDACGSDAQQWARLFQRMAKLPSECLRVLGDSPLMQPCADNHFASLENILTNLDWVFDPNVEIQERFFIFCGHGMQQVAEDFAGTKMCQHGLCPADIWATLVRKDTQCSFKTLSDTHIHERLIRLPAGISVTIITDACYGGKPLDRDGYSFLQPFIDRGATSNCAKPPCKVRYLDVPNAYEPNVVEPSPRVRLRCSAIHWQACDDAEVCVEMAIDEGRTRGAFSYFFVSSLVKLGPHSLPQQILDDIVAQTKRQQGQFCLQQTPRVTLGGTATMSHPFLRPTK